jgi:hypothetical protein
VNDRITEYGEIIENDTLETLPMANLALLEIQLSRMKKTKQIDLRNGGRGDSQYPDLQEVGN